MPRTRNSYVTDPGCINLAGVGVWELPRDRFDRFSSPEALNRGGLGINVDFQPKLHPKPSEQCSFSPVPAPKLHWWQNPRRFATRFATTLNTRVANRPPRGQKSEYAGGKVAK